MKKLCALCIAAVLAGTVLAGCGQQEEPAASGALQSPPPQVAPSPQLPKAHEPTFALEADVNPYTGLAKKDGYPEGQRGVAVMLNNVRAALPQSGINEADILYEMVTESGITRLMALYRDYKTMPTVGPLRSARDQHIQLMIPLNSLYAHIGTSSYAAEMLETYRYLDTKAIDGKYKSYYWIDTERRKTLGQEHCVYTNGQTFAEAVEKYAMDTQAEPAPAFNFRRYDVPPRVLEGGEGKQLYVRFSSYADSVFEYRQETGRYYKSEFNQPQIDANTEEQYSADNLLVLFADVSKYPDGVLSHINFDSQGAALYFCGGRYERVRWMKGSPADPLRIVDAQGKETDVSLNPGQTYVAVVGMDQVEHCQIDGVSLSELDI